MPRGHQCGSGRLAEAAEFAGVAVGGDEEWLDAGDEGEVLGGEVAVAAQDHGAEGVAVGGHGDAELLRGAVVAPGLAVPAGVAPGLAEPAHLYGSRIGGRQIGDQGVPLLDPALDQLVDGVADRLG